MEAEEPTASSSSSSSSSATVPRVNDFEPRFLTEVEAPHFTTVAMASYPRSGNSLLRVLLEKVTGYITGSDTRPDRKLSRELLDYGLLGEGVVDTNKVWIIKTHFPERFGYKRFKVKKIILLVRNPFDTLDSYFNMVLTSSHTKSLDESEYERLKREWEELVQKEIIVWKKFYEYYLYVASKNDVPFKVVRYEDLMERRWQTMRGLICFLYNLKTIKGTVYEDRILALAAREQSENDQKAKLQAYKPRKGKIDHSLAHFSTEQRTFIAQLTRDLLCFFGYTKYLDAAILSPPTQTLPTAQNDAPAESGANVRTELTKDERRLEKQEIVAYILQNYQDSRIYLTPGLLHVNFGLPLREVTPTDPFGRGMSWKKEVLARSPVTLERPQQGQTSESSVGETANATTISEANST